MNLVLVILIPLLTALAVLSVKQVPWIKWLALSGAIIQMSLVSYLCYQYMQHTAISNGSTILFESIYSWYPAWNIRVHFGVDGISIAMLLLTALVVLSGVLISWRMEKMTKSYFFLLMLLSLGAYGFFISLDLFTLFFFLELAVIPKYLLIAIWGSGNKSYAANKLALMLMSGSVFILVGILGLYFATDPHSFSLMELSKHTFKPEIQRICFPLLFVGFGIFAALFPFHTWVPDGHSSAPTAGSMFLAGISMKLGGYGCLRLAIFLMPEAAKIYAPIIIGLSAIAIIYGAMATLMQRDLKYMNAYSSVSHCGFVLLGLGMLTQTAIQGAVLQMISHGLMTALFFAVIGMIYERTHTRMIQEMGGLMQPMPWISTLLFIAGLCSLGLPGLSGFVAEMTIFVGSWEHTDLLRRTATVLACMSIVVTAVYILRAIGKTAMGPLKKEFSQLADAGWHEKVAAIVLLAGILFMGIMPFWIQQLIAPSVAELMKKIAG